RIRARAPSEPLLGPALLRRFWWTIRSDRTMPHQPTPSPGDPSPTLRDLSAAASRGDRAAFEQIHRRLGGGVRRLLLARVGNRPELADELAQRTWVAAWEALRAGRYDPSRAEFSTFIYAVAYKTWLR